MNNNSKPSRQKNIGRGALFFSKYFLLVVGFFVLKKVTNKGLKRLTTIP